MPPRLTISPLLDMKRPGLPNYVRVSDQARVGRDQAGALQLPFAPKYPMRPSAACRLIRVDVVKGVVSISVVLLEKAQRHLASVAFPADEPRRQPRCRREPATMALAFF
jgi:hypothetical protein